MNEKEKMDVLPHKMNMSFGRMKIEGDAVPYFGNTTDDAPLTSETRSSALTAPILRNSKISHIKRQITTDVQNEKK